MGNPNACENFDNSSMFNLKAKKKQKNAESFFDELEEETVKPVQKEVVDNNTFVVKSKRQNPFNRDNEIRINQ